MGKRAQRETLEQKLRLIEDKISETIMQQERRLEQMQNRTQEQLR